MRSLPTARTRAARRRIAALALGLVSVLLRDTPVTAHGGLGHGLGHGWLVTMIEIALVAAFAAFAAYSLYHRRK